MTDNLLIDYYELTMANAYFEKGFKDQTVYFDLFFRSIPDQGGYALTAGLESVINYIENLIFTSEEIEYLRKQSQFSDAFLDYLAKFKFTGDIYAVNEGSVVFPNEPIITIRANIIEAQLLETQLLLLINHQSLIATKASRIKQAAQHRQVIEMGARRAHGASSAILGARAAYIGGVDTTSNTYANFAYDIPVGGTMAHSFVQLFDTEVDAFRAYAETYPQQTTLLVDTYDTLKSGVPNAIKVIKDVLIPKGANNYAIRIDSGDLTYLSKAARQMLDDAGLKRCKIIASNALDEHLIKALIEQEAPIDVFGVGERLITAKSDPVFGAVYKLVALEQSGKIIPKIKLSDNPKKINTPHFKQLYRIYNQTTHKACADLITLRDETMDAEHPLTIFNPEHPWQTTTFNEYYLKPMLLQVMKKGQRITPRQDLKTIRDYTHKELQTLWDELKRFEHPHQYYVDLSQKLYEVKMDLITKK